VRSLRAARLATGPLAFLLAGAIDAAAAWCRWAWMRLHARLTGRPAPY
jgi:hypothetical protein